MQTRIDQVADPEIGAFNIAIPNLKRLAVFEKICSSKNKTEAHQENSKVQKNGGPNKIFVKAKQPTFKKNKLKETKPGKYSEKTSINETLLCDMLTFWA